MKNRLFTSAIAATSVLALSLGLSGTAFAAPNYNPYPHKISGMVAPNATTTVGHFASSDGTKIYYKFNDVANEKATIVVNHGLLEHSGRYDYVTYRLNMAGFDVYRMDHRGHGQSAAPYNNVKKGNVDNFNLLVDDINQVVKMARGTAHGKKVIMLGHSMGAIATQHYVTKYPTGVDLAVTNGGGVPLNPYGKNTLKPTYITPKNLPAENNDLGKTPQEKLPFVVTMSNFKGILPQLMDKGVVDANKIGFTSPAPLQEVAFENSLGDVVCTDEAVRNDYGKDSLNGTAFTGSTGVQMFVGLLYAAYNAKDYTRPMLIMHAKSDMIVPMYWSINWLNASASKDKSMVVWNGLYHETMNEPVRDQIIDYALNWINARL